MYGGVAAGGPASAKLQIEGVIHAADIDVALGAWTRLLGVAAEAKIGIRFGQQFGVDRTMRLMTDRAAFTQGGMFVNKWPGLLAMAVGAHFVLARHGQAAGGLHDVHAVRVVALDAVHFAFEHRMVLRIMKFGLHFQVALQAGLRVLAGIDDEFF